MNLEHLLSLHQAHDEKERRDLADMRSLARTLESPLSRTQRPAHFTGSAVVVNRRGDRVCLVLHAKLGRWLQPGGHADPVDNGSLENTALREAREETGLRVTSVDSAPIDVDVHVIPERKDEPEHRHLDVRFLLVAEQEAALAPDPDESLGAQWLSWNEALERADEAPLKRLLEKARHVTQTWTRRFDLSL